MGKHKCVAIIDACSIINLDQVNVSSKTALEWLLELFDVEIAKTVIDEVERNYNLSTNMASKLKRRQRTENYSQLEQGYLNTFIKLGELDGTRIIPGTIDDAGERHSCCLAVDGVKRKRNQQVVIISDDEGAMKYLFQPILSKLPVGSLWTSAEFLFYIYLCNSETVKFQHLENALRDFVAVLGSARGQPPGAIPVSVKLQNRLSELLKRLALVSKIS